MNTISIRPATGADIDAINEIFNHYVLNSTVMFQAEPATAAQRAAWLADRDEAHPAIVAESGAEIVGWGSLSKYYKPPAAARHTVEDSVYVRAGMHGKGIGTLLLSELISLAKKHDYHSIVAEIHDQKPSLALHSKLGFQKVGHIREAGHKMGQWVNVIVMQKMLAPSSHF
jgi:L-amino acid N-acyltransferase YncA